MKKKLLAMVITLVLLFAISTVTAFAGPLGGGIGARSMTVPVVIHSDIIYDGSEAWYNPEHVAAFAGPGGGGGAVHPMSTPIGFIRG